MHVFLNTDIVNIYQYRNGKLYMHEEEYFLYIIWILKYNIWILKYTIWMLKYTIWIIKYTIWILKYTIWILKYTVCVFKYTKNIHSNFKFLLNFPYPR